MFLFDFFFTLRLVQFSRLTYTHRDFTDIANLAAQQSVRRWGWAISLLLSIWCCGSTPKAQAAYALSAPSIPTIPTIPTFAYPPTSKIKYAFTAPLPSTVLIELKRAQIPLSAISIVVEPVASASSILSFQAKKRMNPASTMKLLTTFAGLSMLGPSFQWETRAYVDGPIQEGVLYGNLYLQGTGDPKLVPETLVHFVNAIRSAGITHIEGDLVLDRSYFDPQTRSTPPFDAEYASAYNARPDPLLYAFNAFTFTLTPQPDLSVQVQVQPEFPQLQVSNTLRVTDSNASSCNAIKPVIVQQNRSFRAVFEGTYPLQCGVRTVSRAAPNPTTFLAEGFLGLWGHTGGTHLGAVREGILPQKAQCIAIHKGETLQNIVRDINKNSNNIMVRNLLLTLGAVYRTPPATMIRSERVVRAWLYQKGLHLPGLVLENGAGLSTKESITAQGLANLLQQAYRSSVATPFIDSLPIAGLDGTMRKRLASDGHIGDFRIKTGTLDHVRAIAGYVTDHNGQTYVVVSFINHPEAHQGQAAHDALLRWVNLSLE